MTPTPQQVWEAALTDPKFAGDLIEGSPMSNAIRSFIEGSVEALGDLLNTTVSLESLSDAKIRFLRYCLDNDFAKIVGEAVGMGADMFVELFEQVVVMLEAITKDVSAFLAEHGVTEADVMTGANVGLNAENLKKWGAGTLTIGELLGTQPSVILRND